MLCDTSEADGIVQSVNKEWLGRTDGGGIVIVFRPAQYPKFVRQYSIYCILHNEKGKLHSVAASGPERRQLKLLTSIF